MADSLILYDGTLLLNDDGTLRIYDTATYPDGPPLECCCAAIDGCCCEREPDAPIAINLTLTATAPGDCLDFSGPLDLITFNACLPIEGFLYRETGVMVCGGEWQYEFNCEPQAIVLSKTGVIGNIVIPVTLLSCDPIHGVGSVTVDDATAIAFGFAGGFDIEVEVME